MEGGRGLNLDITAGHYSCKGMEGEKSFFGEGFIPMDFHMAFPQG